jgi:hypothetical protein
MFGFPDLAVFLNGGISMSFQLSRDIRLQCPSFGRWAAWNGFGGQIAGLSSLFEIAFDGGT